MQQMSRYTTRFNKRDANEKAIIKRLAELKIGWTEAGPLDGWVFIRQWIPVEIKTKLGKLTQTQKDFVALCQMHGKPYMMLKDPEDVLPFVVLYRDSRDYRPLYGQSGGQNV